jgi:hypothetical protein
MHSNSSKLGRWPWLFAAAAWLPLSGFGYCLAYRDPEVRQLQELVGKDAKAAVRQSQQLLSTMQPAAPAGAMPGANATLGAGGAAGAGPAAVSRMASLYGVLADAQGMLELDAEARASALKGLALVPDPRDPVHVELMLGFLASVYDAAGIAAGLKISP